MSNTIKLTVVSCTPSSKGGFINKLQHKEVKSIDTAFGKKTQESQVTYYMKTDSSNEVGFSADLDISNLKIVERPFVVDDKNGQEIMLKWLHIGEV